MRRTISDDTPLSPLAIARMATYQTMIAYLTKQVTFEQVERVYPGLTREKLVLAITEQAENGRLSIERSEALQAAEEIAARERKE